MKYIKELKIQVLVLTLKSLHCVQKKEHKCCTSAKTGRH